MLGFRAEAGSRPGGRGTFLCFAKEKYPKERRPPVCDPFAERRGKPASGRLRGAPWNSLCAARAARTATASQFTKHGRFDAHAHPATAPPQAQPAGVGQPNSQHPFGPLLRSAAPAQRVALAPASWGRAQRSEAKARVDVLPLLPLWMRRGAQGLADQGSRLSERSETERVRARPRQTRAPQVAPERSAGDADSGVALSLVPFFRRRERKGLACRATPGLRPQTRHSARFIRKLQQPQPRIAGCRENAIKRVAAKA